MKTHYHLLCLTASFLISTAYAEASDDSNAVDDGRYTADMPYETDPYLLDPGHTEYEIYETGEESEAVKEEVIIVTAPPSVITAARAAYSKGKSTEVLRLLEPFAEMNDSEAQYQLGRLYASKPHKMQNHAKACTWWRKAAELDHPGAQNALAECYANGRGIEQSNKKALQWWKKAAEQGDLEAQYTLGTIYHQGKYGVEKDNAIAREWFKQAAAQGMYKAAAMANKLK